MDKICGSRETLDLTPTQPDYAILLNVSKGFFNDPGYDNDKTVLLKLPAAPEVLDATLDAVDAWDWREVGWNCLDCRVPALIEMVSEAEDVLSLNRLAQKLADMSPNAINTYKALLEAAGYPDLDQAELLLDEIENQPHQGGMEMK